MPETTADDPALCAPRMTGDAIDFGLDTVLTPDGQPGVRLTLGPRDDSRAAVLDKERVTQLIDWFTEWLKEWTVKQ